MNSNCQVLERSKLEFSRNDYAISVAPNTHRLLLEQGTEDTHLEATVLTYVWGCDADGKLVQETLAESLARFGTTTIFTRRSRLHAELHSLATGNLRPGKPARIIEEVKITSVDLANATITTESGDTYRGDLIIGADGINSAVRAAVLSTNPGFVDVANGAAAVPTGLAAYLCTVPNAVLREDPVLAFQTGEKSGMAAFHGADPQKRVLVFPADAENFHIVAYHSEVRWVEQFTAAGSSILKDVPAERAVQDFLDFHPSIQKMLARATTPDVWRIRDLERLPKWHSGKAILIGDAAHAVTPRAYMSFDLTLVCVSISSADFGQGCNIAIEDGEALGYFLQNLESAAQLPAAIESFESIRIPRAHMVQFASRQVGGLLTEEERKKAVPFDSAAFMTKVYGYTSAKDTWEILHGLSESAK
ncbi:hypothetical protein C8F04DRAFT_1256575 [Mycena alexandri]|uniref:FAD-binding domain-containing protein n=1 Tax=Mycena alexandri TaxID=1745969 RepID=A0AAD6T0T6_9AGAR|nr:hypothetical protein C8F04DRAFT_1256575 [Mycena alexandri]